MPNIASARKQMRKDVKKRARRLPFKTRLKTETKKVLEICKAGKVDDAKKLLGATYSVIDTACKKRLIHKNTAARRKSRLARAIASLEKKKG